MPEQLPEAATWLIVAQTLEDVVYDVMAAVRSTWMLWRIGDFGDAATKNQLAESIVGAAHDAWFRADVIAAQVVGDPHVVDVGMVDHEAYEAHIVEAVNTLWDDLDDTSDEDGGDSSLSWDDDTAAVDTGETTLMLDGGDVDVPARVERLATAEPTSQFQIGMQAAYEKRGAIGYTRGLDADPCELCQWLWKSGHVYPISKPMHKHVGCQCFPVPVFETNEGEQNA